MIGREMWGSVMAHIKCVRVSVSFSVPSSQLHQRVCHLLLFTKHADCLAHSDQDVFTVSFENHVALAVVGIARLSRHKLILQLRILTKKPVKFKEF